MTTAQLKDVWNIDCQAMFRSYNNFMQSQSGIGSDVAYGGLAFGRPAMKEIVHVFFVNADSFNVVTAEFITSCLSADLELVAQVSMEGMTMITPIDVGTRAFTIYASQEILVRSDTNGFLDLNGMLNATQFSNTGISLRTSVGFECNLRVGCESDDLKRSAERYISELFRFVFINQEKGIVLRKLPDKEKIPNVLSEHAKGAFQYKDSMEFTALQSLTRNTKDDKEDQKMVPIVRITRDGLKYINVSAVFTVVVPAFSTDDSNAVYDRFLEGIRRRVQNHVYGILTRLNKQLQFTPSETAVYYPPHWTTLLHLQLPQWSDDEMKTYRQKLHKLLNLPTSTPCLRLGQRIPFGGAAASKLLRNPHISITNFRSNGSLSLVQGPYNYHHYMQDNFDDSGWGCAYRSLQTIWSWFVLNGYVDKPVPSHREIQQCLVSIGDKEDKFIGSRQWIGSMEIGFVLETLLGIESRFITTNSGAEVSERVSEIAAHFDQQGTPVMIGGGQYAYTILGVDHDDSYQEVRFLVLDPHYTGSEDIRTVISKGWCGWKPSSFWKASEFYNLILPQRPADAI